MKNNQKGFANKVLIGVIIVILVVGVYFVLRKKSEPVIQTNNSATTLITQNETANWKTYTNSQYGFELKYPQTWSVRITPDGFFDLPDDKAETGKGVESLIHDNVVVSVDNSKKYKSLSDLENDLKSELSLSINSNWNNSSISQKTIGNNNFLVYGWMHQGQGVDYFTLVNGNSLEIRFVMDDTILPIEQSKNYPDFLKLLTTLKFTSSNNNLVLKPAVDLKVNGSDGPLTFNGNSEATLSWTSAGVGNDKCEIFNQRGELGTTNWTNLSSAGSMIIKNFGSGEILITCSKNKNISNDPQDTVVVYAQR